MVKVSIRISILALFAMLLVSVGSAIMFVNYIMGKEILLNATKSSVEIAYNNISERIVSFLQPLNERIDVGARTISTDLITPSPDDKFTKFLLHILGDSPNFYGIHWSDPQGNFYYIERSVNGTFISEKVICSLHACVETTQKIDGFGKALTPPNMVLPVFDPRVRPWYIKATNEKHYILSDIYLYFYRPNVGVTASYPIYYSNGSLRGVLSIDEALSALSNFVSNIKITQHSNVFIFTGNDELVAAEELQNFRGEVIPKVMGIDKLWIQESFKLYKSSKKTLFFYKYNGEQYLAYYHSIQKVVNNPWYIAIVLPVSDVTSALMRSLTTSVLIAVLILSFGMLLVSIISRAISRPIVGLTKEAALIEQMNLSEVVPLQDSRIKEINLMQEAFSAMKQSLTSFIRYVPATLVKKLIASGDVAHVGGESKEISFLFSDIEHFTSLTENVDPQEVMRKLSQYFEIMHKIILTQQGTLDKYIGDAIMAFWGAPLDDEDHVAHACRCAIKMQEAVTRINEASSKNGNLPITIRIGVNTGVAVVGNVGSEERLSYTVLGDSVNLASRLEELNKVYHTKIIVGENTYRQVKDKFVFRLLDQVAVRGKNKSSYVYELLRETPTLSAKVKEYENIFLEAFAFYQKGEWDSAITIFEKLGNLYLGDHLMELYLERCKNFKNNPPAKWEGIWRIS